METGKQDSPTSQAAVAGMCYALSQVHLRRTNTTMMINTHILLYIKEVINKDLLSSTGNYAQYPVIN